MPTCDLCRHLVPRVRLVLSARDPRGFVYACDICLTTLKEEVDPCLRSSCPSLCC